MTPIGEELRQDDHSLVEYDLRDSQAALDLSLSGLAESLWSRCQVGELVQTVVRVVLVLSQLT
ncbi:hypothetical protein [Streptomyces sp. NPDC048272]|uniref:hypothetical protein n=1 Tax=Streptomyces sp. NPDC048272 TaxID=3154616 RepID=UPI0033CDBFE8